MQDIGDILQNRVLIVALAACIIAQVFKVVFEFVYHRKVNLRALVETGGMPSSHSALVTALSCGIGQTLGWASPAFAVTTVFAIIVMYDASGIRLAAGKQAKLLNQIVDELLHEKPEFSEERMKELLGHTPVQVIMGSILGLAVSCLAAPAYSIAF
ncbi:MAG: divergent PAP2 family protein [Cyanobacteria bacterium P01_H01_bin.58]